MTNIQKQIVCELLRLSYESGFCAYPIKPIAERLHLSEAEIYDANTEKGLMWEYGSFGNGMISFTNDGHGLYAAIYMDAKDVLEAWSDFR